MSLRAGLQACPRESGGSNLLSAIVVRVAKCGTSFPISNVFPPRISVHMWFVTVRQCRQACVLRPGPARRLALFFNSTPIFRPKPPKLGLFGTLCLRAGDAQTGPAENWLCLTRLHPGVAVVHATGRSGASALLLGIGFVFTVNLIPGPKTHEIGFVWRDRVPSERAQGGTASL